MVQVAMKQFLLLLFYFQLSCLVIAQEDSLIKKCHINGRVDNVNTGSGLDCVKVELLNNSDSLLNSEFTTKNGKWKLAGFPIGEIYKIIFSKNGFYTKYVIIDLMNIPDSITSPFDVVADLSLLDKHHSFDCDTSFSKWPVTRLKFSIATGELEWDRNMIEKYKSKMDKCISCIEKNKIAEMERIRMQHEIEQKQKQTEESKD